MKKNLRLSNPRTYLHWGQVFESRGCFIYTSFYTPVPPWHPAVCWRSSGNKRQEKNPTDILAMSHLTASEVYMARMAMAPSHGMIVPSWAMGHMNYFKEIQIFFRLLCFILPGKPYTRWLKFVQWHISLWPKCYFRSEDKWEKRSSRTSQPHYTGALP